MSPLVNKPAGKIDHAEEKEVGRGEEDGDESRSPKASRGKPHPEDPIYEVVVKCCDGIKGERKMEDMRELYKSQ